MEEEERRWKGSGTTKTFARAYTHSHTHTEERGAGGVLLASTCTLLLPARQPCACVRVRVVFGQGDRTCTQGRPRKARGGQGASVVEELGGAVARETRHSCGSGPHKGCALLRKRLVKHKHRCIEPGYTRAGSVAEARAAVELGQLRVHVAHLAPRQHALRLNLGRTHQKVLRGGGGGKVGGGGAAALRNAHDPGNGEHQNIRGRQPMQTPRNPDCTAQRPGGGLSVQQLRWTQAHMSAGASAPEHMVCE